MCMENKGFTICEKENWREKLFIRWAKDWVPDQSIARQDGDNKGGALNTKWRQATNINLSSPLLDKVFSVFSELDIVLGWDS